MPNPPVQTRIFYIADNLLAAAYSFGRKIPATSIPGKIPDGYVPEAADYHYVATIAATDPEDAFAKMNRGSGRELPVLEGRRSLSVGDIIYIGDFYYLCRPAGWQRLDAGPTTSSLARMAVEAENDADRPRRCAVCGGLNPGDITHARC